MTEGNTTPYNLRINPRKSQKMIDNQLTDENNAISEKTTTCLPQSSELSQNTDNLNQSTTENDDHASDTYSCVTETHNITVIPDYISQLMAMITQLGNKLDTSLTQVDHSISQVDDKINQIDSRIAHIETNMIEMETRLENKITNQINSLLKETEQKINNEYNEKMLEIENQLKNVQNDLQMDITDTNYKINQYKTETNLTNETLQTEIKSLKTSLKCTNQALTSKIEENYEQTNLTLNEHSQSMKELKNNENRPFDLSDVISHFSPNNLDVPTMPKFSGRANNPKEYLIKLKNYYERVKDRTHLSKTNPTQFLYEIIEDSLEYHALKWWQLAKDHIFNWDDFSKAFLNRYWSKEVQRGIKQRIELERYRPDGRLTKAEYFVEKVIVLKTLSPTPTDEEIVSLLTEHFSELVQNAVRVQNIQTTTDFELMLQREDNLDQLKTALHQNTTSSYNKQKFEAQYNEPSHKTNPRLNDKINLQAFDPKGYDPPRKRPPFENRNRPNDYHQRNQPYNNYHNTYNRNGNPNRQSHYPTQEQRQACHVIAERNNPEPNGNEYRNRHNSN